MSRTIHPQEATPASRPAQAARAAHAARSARSAGQPRRGPGRRTAQLALGVSAALVVTLGVGLLGVATTAASAASSTGGARSTTKAVPVPAVPAGLPTGIEDLAVYVRQVSCDPTPKPGALALGRLLATTYAGTGYVIGSDCGSDAVPSEHEEGRAVDWVVSTRSATQKAEAQAFLGWLFATDESGRAFAEARRLGVMYIIWDGRIWGAWNPLDGWSAYSTCAAHPEAAADAVCRRNRMTISLSWDGAMARDSFWSRSVSAPDYGPCRPKDLNWAPAWSAPNRKPCPSYPVLTAAAGADAVLTTLVRFSGATVGPGDAGPAVSAVQQALNVTADGQYGPFTADAVAAFQTQHGLAASGAVDAATWRDLLAVHAVRIPVAETPNPTTSTLTRYLTTVLRYGDRGSAVLALQKALKVTRSGWFGPVTRAAVVALQVRAKLPGTGIVDAATWRLLGA